MATFEIWGAGAKEGTTSGPLHTVEANRFTVEAGVIIFRDKSSEQVHAVVLSPGLVVKKVK
jgi:hypothetical protein